MKNAVAIIWLAALSRRFRACSTGISYSFRPGEAGAKSVRQARGTPVHQADTDGVLIPAVKIDQLLNMRVVGANAPTIVADRELSLDLGRFQSCIPSLMPDVAGQSTGGSQVRKKPTSPGMPSGKLIIIALSP